MSAQLAAGGTSAAQRSIYGRRRLASPIGNLLAACCLILTACSSGVPALLARGSRNGSAAITVDGAQRFQTIDGFGVNANSLPWDHGMLTPALEQLTDTMGAAVWRVIVESTQGWEDTPDTSDVNSYNWSYYGQLYSTPKFEALWGVLGYLQQKRVPTIMLNVMGCPPSWMGDCAIDPANEDYYVKMEASLLYYARSVKHLRIDVFSPMNEEDHGDPEGPHVSSDQYVRILDKLSARLDALGLSDIRLLGPDTASVGAAISDYAPALLADPALMARIAHFGLHDYGGSAGGMASVIAASAYPTRTFWMTEYSAWCDGCDNGAPNPNNWDFATNTLDDLFNFIDQGASSALVYDGYDSFYEHHGSMGYWGLLAYNATTKTYTPRKRFYTVAQVVKFARPGMVRIRATSSDASLRLFAFTDPVTGALTIVGRNPNTTAETLHGALAHVAAPAKLALYQTTPTENMARAPDVPVSSGSFTAGIAPNSVFTLTTLASASGVVAVATPTTVPTTTSTGPGGIATLGNTAVGSVLDNGDSNYLNGSRFSTGAHGGTVTRMSVHVGEVSPAPNNQYALAIYTDNGGRPGSLIAHSVPGTLTPNAWNSLPIHATVSPHTAYWLMYNTNGTGDASNNMHMQPDGSVAEAYSASVVLFGKWPDTFGSAVVGTGSFSLYATYAMTAAGAADDTALAPILIVVVLLVLAVSAGIVAALYWVSRRAGLPVRLPWRS